MIAEFYDASDPNDVENMTLEVIEEADEHYIFYEVSGVKGIYLGFCIDGLVLIQKSMRGYL